MPGSLDGAARTFQRLRRRPSWLAAAERRSPLASYFTGGVEYDARMDLPLMDAFSSDFARFIDLLGVPPGWGRGVELKFRRLGRHRAEGLYFPDRRILALDVRTSRSFAHEFGHLVDYRSGARARDRGAGGGAGVGLGAAPGIGTPAGLEGLGCHDRFAGHDSRPGHEDGDRSGPGSWAITIPGSTAGARAGAQAGASHGAMPGANPDCRAGAMVGTIAGSIPGVIPGGIPGGNPGAQTDVGTPRSSDVEFERFRSRMLRRMAEAGRGDPRLSRGGGRLSWNYFATPLECFARAFEQWASEVLPRPSVLVGDPGRYRSDPLFLEEVPLALDTYFRGVLSEGPQEDPGYL
jgi:hypothetical protein